MVVKIKLHMCVPYHRCSHLLPSQSTTGQSQCDLPQRQQGVVNFHTIRRVAVWKSYASKENSYLNATQSTTRQPQYSIFQPQESLEE